MSLFLPRTLKMPAFAPDLMPHAADDVAGNAAQVLVVEDDDEVAALTVEMIDQLGYDQRRERGGGPGRPRRSPHG